MAKYIDRRKLIVRGAVVSLILILAISLGFLIYGRIFSAKVSIMVVPSIAKVKIGDTVFSSYEEVNIQPGEYTVEISAKGFASKTGKLVAKADETSNLFMYLESNSPDTANWYEENSGDALILGEIQSQEMIERVNKLMEKEPVLKELPLTVEYFSEDYTKYVKYIISYELDNSERGFRLIMKDYTGEGADAAFAKLREMGMELGDIKMEYEDLTGDRLNFRAE